MYTHLSSVSLFPCSCITMLLPSSHIPIRKKKKEKKKKNRYGTNYVALHLVIGSHWWKRICIFFFFRFILKLERKWQLQIRLSLLETSYYIDTVTLNFFFIKMQDMIFGYLLYSFMTKQISVAYVLIQSYHLSTYVNSVCIIYSIWIMYTYYMKRLHFEK